MNNKWVKYIIVFCTSFLLSFLILSSHLSDKEKFIDITIMIISYVVGFMVGRYNKDRGE